MTYEETHPETRIAADRMKEASKACFKTSGETMSGADETFYPGLKAAF